MFRHAVRARSLGTWTLTRTLVAWACVSYGMLESRQCREAVFDASGKASRTLAEADKYCSTLSLTN